MNTQDRDLILALCNLGQLSEADEEFVDEVAARVLDMQEQLTPEQRTRALTLQEKHS